MFRWVSLLFSAIATLLFIVTLFVIEAGTGCPDWPHMAMISSVRTDQLSLAPQFECTMFYVTLSSWTVLCAAGLTLLLLIIHLLVAAKKRLWGWFTTLFVWPSLCVISGGATVGQIAGGYDGGFMITMFCLFGGLINLLFGIVILKPWQAAPKGFPADEVLPS